MHNSPIRAQKKHQVETLGLKGRTRQIFFQIVGIGVRHELIGIVPNRPIFQKSGERSFFGLDRIHGPSQIFFRLAVFHKQKTAKQNLVSG